ncbi:MAG: hypothetical protein IMZ55_05585, partial [Acidobacteria bacterium]|nr:hypothetical protein [Acidobacteriota bacterium]
MNDSRDLPETPEQSRRSFLRLGGAVAAAVASQAFSSAARGATAPAQATLGTAATPTGPPVNPATAQAMPTRNLGRIGFKVGIFSLGGQSVLERARQEDAAIPLIERALDLGVNYIDTSSIYGGPERW